MGDKIWLFHEFYSSQRNKFWNRIDWTGSKVTLNLRINICCRFHHLPMSVSTLAITPSVLTLCCCIRRAQIQLPGSGMWMWRSPGTVTITTSAPPRRHFYGLPQSGQNGTAPRLMVRSLRSWSIHEKSPTLGSSTRLQLLHPPVSQINSYA